MLSSFKQFQEAKRRKKKHGLKMVLNIEGEPVIVGEESLTIPERSIEKKLVLSSKLTIKEVDGLMPSKKKGVFPFFWKDANGQIPQMIRWSWQPASGDFLITSNAQPNFHSMQIQKFGSGHEYESWLRGFYFPAKNQLVIRTYFNPSGVYDDWNAKHREIDQEVETHFIVLIERVAKHQFEVQTGVNNNYLRNTYSRISLDW